MPVCHVETFYILIIIHSMIGCTDFGLLRIYHFTLVFFLFLFCPFSIYDLSFTFFLLQTSSAHSWTCMDLYVFATPYRVTWDYYFSAREHTLEIESWEEPAELEYVCFLFIYSIVSY